MFALKTAASKAAMPAVRVASRRCASSVASRSGNYFFISPYNRPLSYSYYSRVTFTTALVSTRQALSAGNKMVRGSSLLSIHSSPPVYLSMSACFAIVPLDRQYA
jgi:hypothetical protein